MTPPTPPDPRARDAPSHGGPGPASFHPWPSPTRLAVADRALVLALRAWGPGDGPGLLGRFRPSWGEELRSARDEIRDDPGSAVATLRAAHEAAARPDPDHVHPSWWIRALKDEAPSVRRAVAAHADPRLRPILRRGKGPGPSYLPGDRPPVPDVLRWALVLWAERIVGDLSRWPDDPPVVRALSRLGLREVLALARASGLLKRSLAGVDPSPSRPRPSARLDGFRQAWGEPGPDDRAQAMRDVEASLAGRGRGHGRGATRLGLVTFGRLLATVEPYRTRWTLQHLPYPLARSIRPAINEREATLADWEGEILRVAWDRLVAEGRVRAPGALES